MAVYEKWCQANNLKPSKNVQSEKYQQNAKLLCQVFMNGVCSIFAVVPGGAGQADKTTIRALHNCESERFIEVVLGLGYVAVFPVINTRGRHK